jgi:hypothetical protein
MTDHFLKFGQNSKVGYCYRLASFGEGVDGSGRHRPFAEWK